MYIHILFRKYISKILLKMIENQKFFYFNHIFQFGNTIATFYLDFINNYNFINVYLLR